MRMWPIVTNVAWSEHVDYKTTEPIEVQYGVWCMDSGGPREPCFRWGVEEAILGEGQTPAHCEVQGISDVSQSYSVGGSSDAAFRCQYCSD